MLSSFLTRYPFTGRTDEDFPLRGTEVLLTGDGEDAAALDAPHLHRPLKQINFHDVSSFLSGARSSRW